MIIEYTVATFKIVNINMGSDATLIARWTALKPAGDAVFAVTDDANVLANPYDYYVVESMAVPVGTALNRVITMTSSADPIDLHDAPTITIQLMESDGTTPLSEVATVTLSVNKGILSAPTVTTNGSGVGTLTYKPAKEAGVATITATSPTFTNATLSFVIDTPSTDATQNWLESNDIKAGAVTTEKLAADAVINSNTNKFRQTNPSTWWFAEKGYVQDYWYVGLADSVNNIVGDDDRYIYVHGYAVTGDVDPSVVKVDRYNGATGGIYTFASAGLDGMAYDGRYVYTTALTDMLRIDPQDMTLNDTIASGSASQFHTSRWDAEGALYTYLYGGGDYRMSRIYPANGDIDVLLTGLPGVVVPHNVEMANNTVIWAMGGLIYFFHRRTGTYDSINIVSDLGINSSIRGIVATNDKLFVAATPLSGTTTVIQITWAWDAAFALIVASVDATIDATQTGDPWAIAYDGVYTWIATEEPLPNAGTGSACLLQKLGQSSSAPTTLEILQTINLGEDWSIGALYVDNNRLYATNINAVE